MAIREARTLNRWVVESQQPHFAVTRPLGDQSSRDPFAQARVDAEVELGQSLVPGATELFEITSFDIDNYRTHVEYDGDDSDSTAHGKSSIYERRVERTKLRIRLWAFDPEGEAQSIRDELYFAEDNAVEYLMFGESLSIDES